jgi:hypothetical protein
VVGRYSAASSRIAVGHIYAGLSSLLSEHERTAFVPLRLCTFFVPRISIDIIIIIILVVITAIITIVVIVSFSIFIPVFVTLLSALSVLRLTFPLRKSLNERKVIISDVLQKNS